MRKTTAKTVNITCQDEVTILVRVLCNEEGELPDDIARYLLTLRFGERDKGRMHDLAVRNQEGTLSAAQREELFAYAKAGILLSILKAKAHRILGIRPKKRITTSGASMGKGHEQVSRDIFSVSAGKPKRAAKKAMARHNRRWAKRDPQNAPRKHFYRGWYWRDAFLRSTERRFAACDKRQGALESRT